VATVAFAYDILLFSYLNFCARLPKQVNIIRTKKDLTMKSDILWEIRDISACLRKCCKYCKLLTAQNTFLKMQSFQFVLLIFLFQAQFWLGDHTWYILALGVLRARSFISYRFLFVSPVLLSVSMVKKLVQCKTVLRQSAWQYNIIIFGMKRKSQETIRSSHNK
jgi:hypothetical protein